MSLICQAGLTNPALWHSLNGFFSLSLTNLPLPKFHHHFGEGLFMVLT